MSPFGILVSQIGYQNNQVIRILVRGPAQTVPAQGLCHLGDHQAPLIAWGEQWGTWWWIAEFPAGIASGSYAVWVDTHHGREDGDEAVIGEAPLWEATWRHCSYEMLERRAIFAKVKPGWFDAGMLWQEANAHACGVLGLCDVLEHGGNRIDDNARSRIVAQLVVGCSYLGACQDQAPNHGHGEGALCHDLLEHQTTCIPGDLAKAATAWARTARLLPASHAEQAADYRARSARALAWFASGTPLGNRGFAPYAHGVDASYTVPLTWRTEDNLQRVCAMVELARGPQGDAWLTQACALAREIAGRQILKDAAEHGLWGHFRTFGDTAGHTTGAANGPSSKAWTHCFYDGFGQDVGASFPYWIMPFCELLSLFPQHQDAPLWRTTVENLAYGFLLPACQKNPFGIIPAGVHPSEGVLWFGGLWHGMNAVYGLAAAQFVVLAKTLNDPQFIPLAHANLQWIAGLNAGLTHEGLGGCVVYSADIPADRALPVSMICGIGQRWAGSWLMTRGSICNGFSADQQFRFDLPPQAATDAPRLLTDEDWIPHAAGWLSGISRLP